jgi:hypothetical protein
MNRSIDICREWFWFQPCFTDVPLLHCTEERKGFFLPGNELLKYCTYHMLQEKLRKWDTNFFFFFNRASSSYVLVPVVKWTKKTKTKDTVVVEIMKTLHSWGKHSVQNLGQTGIKIAPPGHRGVIIQRTRNTGYNTENLGHRGSKCREPETQWVTIQVTWDTVGYNTDNLGHRGLQYR